LVSVRNGKTKKEKTMPMVGKKKFAYTKKGKAAAKKYAKKSGKKMKSKY
jgi:hypothetical protein